VCVCDYVIWGGRGGLSGLVDHFFNGEGGNPQCQGANFFQGWGMGQLIVSLTFMKNLALQCGCSVPVAEWLDSSTVGIAQLAHAVNESILCHEGRRHGSSQITLGRTCFLLSAMGYMNQGAKVHIQCAAAVCYMLYSLYCTLCVCVHMVIPLFVVCCRIFERKIVTWCSVTLSDCSRTAILLLCVRLLVRNTLVDKRHLWIWL